MVAAPEKPTGKNNDYYAGVQNFGFYAIGFTRDSLSGASQCRAPLCFG
jgi:hypothetical protein